MKPPKSLTRVCLCDWDRVYVDNDPKPVTEFMTHRDPECPIHRYARIIIFKEGGKYYTEERWLIPEGAIGPYDMVKAPEAQKWKGWYILVETQEPWGYPHLITPSSQIWGDGDSP